MNKYIRVVISKIKNIIAFIIKIDDESYYYKVHEIKYKDREHYAERKMLIVIKHRY